MYYIYIYIYIFFFFLEGVESSPTLLACLLGLVSVVQFQTSFHIYPASMIRSPCKSLGIAFAASLQPSLNLSLCCFNPLAFLGKPEIALETNRYKSTVLLNQRQTYQRKQSLHQVERQRWQLKRSKNCQNHGPWLVEMDFKAILKIPPIGCIFFPFVIIIIIAILKHFGL